MILSEEVLFLIEFESIEGLGYEFQNIDQDFGEPHDIKIDILITENKTLRF